MLRPTLTLAALWLSATVATGPDPTPRSEAVHLLNRLGYGARPADLERIAEIGAAAWIDEQLHPERIDDSALQARLAALPTLSLSTRELRAGYEVPREMRRELMQRRQALGDDASEEELRRMRLEAREELAGSLQGSPRQVLVELQGSRLIRAVHSPRQLEEVMVDFWLNHFNVYAGKGPLRFAIGEYERDVIRPHALGRFEDLLLATARSPAMLFYLDNWLSVDPAAAEQRAELRAQRPARRDRRRGPASDPASRQPERPLRRSGLNENYARELLELHTLGVDGGYEQRDVTELARILTGWTIRGLRDQPEFFFDRGLHDRRDKTLLGTRIEGGGLDEGERALHLLATHPSTARFVAFKLARRFVADEPPEALVDRLASTFTATRGDIRRVMTELVRSPEFLAPETRGVKVKTPLEFVASAVRAVDGELRDPRALLRHLEQMGMPPYMQAPPTGYPDVAEEWVSTGGTLARLDFASDLARGALRGVAFDAGVLNSEPALAPRLLPGGASQATLDAADGALGSDAVALLLGSPDFQRR